MGKFEKGHKKLGGKKIGTPNKKSQQWEVFADYCVNGGLEKFQRELDALNGKTFVDAFTNLLEFHKPRLSRTTVVGDATEPIQVNYAPVSGKDK